MVRHIVVVLAITCAWRDAAAWERPLVEDARVIARSELIVVGRLDGASVRRVEHLHKPDEGRSWEHHATLRVETVLKGDAPAKDLPVIIHYGLDPSISDGIVEIRDTGNSSRRLSPVMPDASANCIWMLRRIKDRFGGGDGKTFGIEDPEDLQSLDLEEYLRCYLQPDPEPVVRAHLQKQPAVAARAMRYLAHREIGRIRKLPDASQRVERLLPYWQSRSSWGYRDEAAEALREAGAVAGPYLEAVFDSDPGRRDDIIGLWGDIAYRRAVPRLIELLEQHDRFWAAQTLQKGWWNSDVDSRLTRDRRNIYGETFWTVVALGKLDDPVARDVVQRTRNRWAAFNFTENPQIVEKCEKALSRWPRERPTSVPAPG